MNPTIYLVCAITAVVLRGAPSSPAVVGVPAATFSPEAVYFEVLTNQVPPGVYESAPFTCIVLVPDQNMDPDFVKSPGVMSSVMPIIRPETRLIPRNQAVR